jgi:hypothetical protein
MNQVGFVETVILVGITGLKITGEESAMFQKLEHESIEHTISL